MTNQTLTTLQDLITKYTNYCECEEWHIHDGPDSNADLSNGHRDFDEDKFETALRQLIQATCLGVIGENIEHRDYCDLMSVPLHYDNSEDFVCTCDANGVNESKFEQHTRLAQLVKDEK